MPLDRFQSVDPALLDIEPHHRAIDLGCGTGRHVLELSKGPGTIVGADLSDNDLRAGRFLLEIMRRRGEVHARVHWMQAAGERLPFVDGAFDRVICTETLEHVDDDAALARELVRVMKPGGILAVSVPDELSEKLFWKLSKNYRTHAGGHVRIYDRREIVQLMRDVGLTPYAVRYRHSLETLYWLSHVAFWSEWGQQGPVTRFFRRALDSNVSRQSRVVTALDDIGNRILPKSIVVYSRKPLGPPPSRNGAAQAEAPITLRDEEQHEFGVPEHIPAEIEPRAAQAPQASAVEPQPAEEHDQRSGVEVRAVPAPFAVEPPPVRDAPGAPLSLADEFRVALALPPEQQKHRLMEILRSCRFAFLREVQDVSGEQASTPLTQDGRSLKEIVGHITAWERWHLAGLEEIAEGVGEPGVMSLSGYPEGISRYASLDAFNAARMAEAREKPWSQVLEESAATFDELTAAVERVPVPDLADTAPFFWPELGGTVPCGLYLLMVSAHHYQVEHLKDVVAR
jgi:ubiquinone/menaquinone biosynthesis C-methylase UbiE